LFALASIKLEQHFGENLETDENYGVSGSQYIKWREIQMKFKKKKTAPYKNNGMTGQKSNDMLLKSSLYWMEKNVIR
jgi:hypothetical protein